MIWGTVTPPDDPIPAEADVNGDERVGLEEWVYILQRLAD